MRLTVGVGLAREGGVMTPGCGNCDCDDVLFTAKPPRIGTVQVQD